MPIATWDIGLRGYVALPPTLSNHPLTVVALALRQVAPDAEKIESLKSKVLSDDPVALVRKALQNCKAKRPSEETYVATKLKSVRPCADSLRPRVLSHMPRTLIITAHS